MKRIQPLLAFALLASLICPAAPLFAADPPAKAVQGEKAPSPAELKKLQRAHLAKGNKALNELRNAVRNQKRNGGAGIPKLVAECLSILETTEAEGRAPELSPSAVHRRIAEALSSPLNLRLLPELEKHLGEAARLATSPAEKAEAAYLRASLSLQWGLDEKAEENEKTMMGVFRDKALPWGRRLDMMRFAIENGPLYDLDFEKVAWESIQDEPKAHYTYYRYALRIVTVRGRQIYNKLRPDCSPAHVVDLCDRALADPAVGYRADLVSTKADALVEMRQPEKAERFLRGYATSTNIPVRYDNAMTLGAFHAKAAERYYGEPDATGLRKAIEAYGIAAAARPKSVKPLQRIGETALRLGDHDLAVKTYESIIPLDGGKTNLNTAVGLGNAWYGKGDLEKAVLFYGLYPDRLGADATLNVCHALVALDRLEEAERMLQRYEKVAWGRGAKADARYFRQVVQKRIEAKKALAGKQ